MCDSHALYSVCGIGITIPSAAATAAVVTTLFNFDEDAFGTDTAGNGCVSCGGGMSPFGTAPLREDCEAADSSAVVAVVWFDAVL